MTTFNVYKHPDGALEVIKEGWCWPAFCFAVIWAMFARMWGYAIGMIMFLMVLFAILSGIFGPGSIVAYFVSRLFAFFVALFFGASGNNWKGDILLDRGYKLESTVAAANKDVALNRYHERDVAEPA